MFISKSFIILLSTITIVTNGMGIFYRGTSTLPRADYGMAIGYWNNTISIFGGQDNPDSFVEYNIATDTMHDVDQYWISPGDVFGSSSYFTQIDEHLYAVEEGGRKFVRFNLATKAYEYYWQNVDFPKTVYDLSCLAASKHYLFVVGGGCTNCGSRYKYLQIFNLSSYSFITGPETITGRARFTCAVHPNNNRLYAIGGLGACGSCSEKTIESIYVGNDIYTNITTESWTYNPYDLLLETRQVVSIIWGDDIYAIGGYDFSHSGTYNNFWAAIQVLNTVTGVVTYAESSLDFGVQSAAAIRVGQNLYVFGGAYTLSNSRIISSSNWQYCDLLATRPPTTDPTEAPTKNPTEQTSNPTTSEPTTHPTTYDPTTAMPSYMPTTYKPTTSVPTTTEPSLIPTTSPITLLPTTSQPSNNPSTGIPTTATPTVSPNTLSPTTIFLTTSIPTTGIPTTKLPTTSNPTTYDPTTIRPTTMYPTTFDPTTSNPTTYDPTTIRPTPSVMVTPTTMYPTTSEPTITTVLVYSSAVTTDTKTIDGSTLDFVDGISRVCKIFSIVATIIASILTF